MPKYFFNIRDGRDVFDNVGTELSGMRSIRVHMVLTATALIEEESAEPPTTSGEWEMEAVDEAGKIVATMTFSITKD